MNGKAAGSATDNSSETVGGDNSGAAGGGPVQGATKRRKAGIEEKQR